MSRILSIGMQGPEVGNWQRFLNSALGKSLVVDEDFGPATRDATTAYQTKENLVVGGGTITGTLDPLTRKLALVQGFIPYVQARNFGPLLPEFGKPGSRTVSLIVIHTMEAPDKPDTAENVAAWFSGPDAPRASAHYCVDNDSVVQCVRERDVAWHAQGANSNGIGIEHAGYAKETDADWQSPYNQGMLTLSAKLAARIAKEHGIAVEHRTVDELRSKIPGFCGHIDVNNAFNQGAGHVDPGPHFPWDQYLRLVQANI